jgi:hydrogenase expression/formation protein HypC
MCIGIPMRVVQVDGRLALCVRDLRGGEDDLTRVDLSLAPDVRVGEYVLTHLGSAVRVLEETEARAIDDALQAVALAQQGLPFEHLIADLVDREPQLPAHLRTEEKAWEESDVAAGQSLRMDG